MAAARAALALSRWIFDEGDRMVCRPIGEILLAVVRIVKVPASSWAMALIVRSAAHGSSSRRNIWRAEVTFRSLVTRAWFSQCRASACSSLVLVRKEYWEVFTHCSGLRLSISWGVRDHCNLYHSYQYWVVYGAPLHRLDSAVAHSLLVGYRIFAAYPRNVLSLLDFTASNGTFPLIVIIGQHMYKEYFGFVEMPFSIVPNSRYLFLSRKAPQRRCRT